MAEEHEDKGLPFLAFLAGAGVGALIGATVALLLAPQSGSDSRDDVKEMFGKLKDRSGELAGRAKDATTTFVQDKREAVTRIARGYREGIAEKKEELAGNDSQ
jgi:gas vesicle protein